MKIENIRIKLSYHLAPIGNMNISITEILKNFACKSDELKSSVSQRRGTLYISNIPNLHRHDLALTVLKCKDIYQLFCFTHVRLIYG